MISAAAGYSKPHKELYHPAMLHAILALHKDSCFLSSLSTWQTSLILALVGTVYTNLIILVSYQNVDTYFIKDCSVLGWTMGCVANPLLAVAWACVMYKCVLAILVGLAWESAQSRVKQMKDGMSRPRMAAVESGWAFFSIAPPAFGVETLLMFLVHKPIYIYRILDAVLYRVPRDLIRRFVLLQVICDEDIWDVVTQSSLMLLCETDKSGSVVIFRGDSCISTLFGSNGHPHRAMLVDASTIEIRMRDRHIESATTADGPIQGTKWFSRNDIIMNIIHEYLVMWVHTTTHLASERNAATVAMTGLRKIGPAALFTHSLHDGLLNSPLSPLRNIPVIRYPTNCSRDGVYRDCLYNLALAHPKPPHFLHRIKAPSAFKCFEYCMKAHGLVRKLLKQHQLTSVINVDDFFAATILHHVDHVMIYRVMDRVPSYSFCSGMNENWGSYLLSMVEHTVFNTMWAQQIENPLFSERIINSALPFYQELAEGLIALNPDLGRFASPSCSY